MSTDDVINDVEKITIGEFFSILKRVKLKIMFSIILFLATLAYGIFKTGQYYQINSTAVALGYPFKMSMEKDVLYKILKNEPNEMVHFGWLNLVKNPGNPLDNDDAILTLHRISEKDSSDIKQIGSVVTQKLATKNVFSLLLTNLDSTQLAYAVTNTFDWRGHENNYRFKERYINKNTVQRYYEDGWILEYKVDARGNSIPSSFRWIRN